MKQKLILGTLSLCLCLSACSAQVVPASAPDGTIDPSPSTSAAQATEAPVDNLRFYLANGEEKSFEELSQSHKILTDVGSGVDAMHVYFSRMEEMVNHFPSEQEVRRNLGHAVGKSLAKEDYLKAVALYRKTYDIIYDVPADGTNTIYSVMNRISDRNVEKRYDRMLDSANSKDSPAFRATIEANSRMTSFTYSDNLFNLTPDVYGMTGGLNRDPERTLEQVPAWKVDHAIKLRALTEAP